MYERYYGLHRRPFTVVPQAEFMYLTRQHRMALSLLRYGLTNEGIFSLITGEIGTGKTTLVRYMLRYVKGDVTVGLVNNTNGSFTELMQWILMAFNLEFRGLDKVAMQQSLYEYLAGENAKRRRVVLVVDEAQNLSIEALEELRMLSNMSADAFHGLQMVVVGQPKLRETLRRPELHQFAQRVTVDFHLRPLALEETVAYVDHRLAVAGRLEPGLFDAAALDLIHRESGGVPRLVNLLCDNALVYGFSVDSPVIGGAIVEEMLEDKRALGGWLFEGGRTERGTAAVS